MPLPCARCSPFSTSWIVRNDNRIQPTGSAQQETTMQTNTTGPAQQDQHNRTSTTGPAQQDQHNRTSTTGPAQQDQHNRINKQGYDNTIRRQGRIRTSAVAVVSSSRRFKFQVAVVQARRTVRDRGGLGSGLSKSQPLGGGPRVPYEGSITPMAAA